ncbi:MAG: hypothetical protein NT062_35375 [Proteobacteria bacterium]|nr:hypothetical protein [Pseudomonadota bacterium]
MPESRTETVGSFEMLWDCDHCGTKRLLGKSQRHCAECGAEQNPEKRYFPKDGEAVQVDGNAYVGGDRYCASCNAPMGAKAKNCTACGASMDGTKEVQGIAVTPTAPAATPAPTKSKGLYVLIGVILLVGLVYWRCVRTTEASMAVTNHTWERTIAIEVFGEVSREIWRGEGEIPADATGVVCARAQHGTTKVADGETCRDEKVDKKDGTFDVVKKCAPKYREEPVYGEQCTFTVLDWKPEAPLRASGTGLAATWPSTGVPEKEAARTVGARRQGARSETLKLGIGTQTCEVSETKWKYYTDGQTIKVQVHANGDIACRDL